MAISMDSTYLTHQNILTNSSGVSTDKLSSSLGNIKSETPDDELLEACKGFEQYFVEQVLKEFTNSLEEFKDNKYMEMFGDTLVETMAEDVSESGNLGIANMLYESMKTNGTIV